MHMMQAIKTCRGLYVVLNHCRKWDFCNSCLNLWRFNLSSFWKSWFPTIRSVWKQLSGQTDFYLCGNIFGQAEHPIYIKRRVINLNKNIQGIHSPFDDIPVFIQLFVVILFLPISCFPSHFFVTQLCIALPHESGYSSFWKKKKKLRDLFGHTGSF